MKIKKIEPICLSDYEVSVNPYLTYSQIQNIASEAMKYQTWHERNEIIDYMLLCYATDAVREEIDNTGHEALLSCGLIDKVKETVVNYHRIYEALEYEESLIKQIAMVMEALPKIVKETVEKVIINELH